jgi:5-methyltetrahydropteroyltriglutamate--homocysteine methyltransferase
MHKSVDRILISHVGSLPRGDELGDMLIEEEAGRSVDKRKLEELIEGLVTHVLTKQREAGVDIANDGEQGRVGFQTYVPQRMSGFGGVSKRPYAKEFIEFPQFTKKMLSRIPRTGKVFDAPQAVGELHYRDTTTIAAETARLKRLAGQVSPPFTECFMTEPSPGIIATTMLNAYYPSHEAYLDAVAREIGHEYRAVVDAGFVLQIDAPDLAMERVLLYQDKTDAVRQNHRAAYCCTQQGAGRHSARSSTPACLLGQLGGSAPLRRCARFAAAGAVSGQCRGPEYRVRQSASPARDGSPAPPQIPRPHGPAAGCDRSEE